MQLGGNYEYHRDLPQKEKELGISHIKLAEQTNLSISTINHFFSKQSKTPSIYTVGPICRVLGVSMDQMFGISEFNTPSLFKEQLLSIAQSIIDTFPEGGKPHGKED